jgi:hypothetical protein
MMSIVFLASHIPRDAYPPEQLSFQFGGARDAQRATDGTSAVQILGALAMGNSLSSALYIDRNEERGPG